MKIYFLGIGGIGMSNLAKYFHLKGHEVAGYDKTPSVVTDALQELGISIYFDADEKHIEGVDKMVYTPAIKEHIEFEAAREKGIPMYKRSQILGEISRDYQTLAVAGTHGKTTTSTMLAHLLRGCEIDCTAFLGGISRNLNGNFVFGTSHFAVVEADEFDRSFLTLSPQMAVITSLDADHLDIYGTPDEMHKSYREFAHKVAKEGFVLVHHSVANFDWGREVHSYGIEEGEYQARNLQYGDLCTTFDYISNDLTIKGITLPMPGHHNVLNAVAAITLTIKAGGNVEKVIETLANFKGIYRRFEVHFHSPEISYIDDYAHHPTEIEAAIHTTRSLFPNRQLVAIFQPHLFSRTRDFLTGFAAALSKADVLLLNPIYPAREKPIEGITSERVLELVTTPNKKLIEKTEIVANLAQVIQKPEVILTIGAGDIDREVGKIKEWLQNK
ncbi:MAG: UDP-N-acetylmuramate--L-alanine ligase [Bacteroidia bacterium]